jgi:hypothetical protein
MDGTSASCCSNKDRVRLVMLYALRFESEGQRIAGLMDFLGQAGVRDSSPALFAAAQGILQYGGSDKCVHCAAIEDGALGCDVASLLQLPFQCAVDLADVAVAVCLLVFGLCTMVSAIALLWVWLCTPFH